MEAEFFKILDISIGINECDLTIKSQGFKKAVNGQCQTPASVKTI